ncbi:MAG: hypothetical protein GXP40_08885 [Chloroflexi bacterium]|nr:hypothetical protein [Chloroflexota bacterium]
MSALNKIAHFQNRRDEVPNQELAKELAKTNDRAGIQEIAENLWNKDRRIQSDCIKVLYETGYLKPELVAAYVDDFLKLLKSKHNRLVWGSMIALSTIAELKAAEIYARREEIMRAMEKGSVITVDGAVKTLAIVASQNDEYGAEIFPYLLKHLETCRPKDVPQHAEKIAVAVNTESQAAFIAVLEKRMTDMSNTQMKRLKKVMAKAENR